MPISNHYNFISSNQLLWKLSETETELKNLLNPSTYPNSRLNLIKSSNQRKQFLGVQNLLKLLKINSDTLFYDNNGKPHLSNNKFISISHSFDYCGVIILDTKVGIDIEKIRPKILNISKKFVSNSELKLIKEYSVRNITKVWTIKEAVFKAFGYPGIDFKKNIIIETLNKEFDKVRVKVFKNEIIDLKPISTWYKNSVCLLGDAAHAITPNMGQGACQAIEDAYVISHYLSRYPANIAFSKYEQLRKSKADMVVNLSWRFGYLSQIRNPFVTAVRNFFMRSIPNKYNIRQSEKLYRLPKL